MKTEIVKTVVEELGGKLQLTGIDIDGKEHGVTIRNVRGCLSLCFAEGTQAPDGESLGEFCIIVKDGKLTFSRHCYRPKHDHDDQQYLQMQYEEPQPGELAGQRGKIFWSSEGPWRFNKNERGQLEIPFGPVTVGY